jgi:hypothetical protein
MDAPMCEECDLEMHPFAFDGTEGYACMGCGWSFDTTEPEEAPVVVAKEEPPYLEITRIVVDRFYNPAYGDSRECVCGHPYYRHFDTYEEMYPCGCKYCECRTFVEKK